VRAGGWRQRPSAASPGHTAHRHTSWAHRRAKTTALRTTSKEQTQSCGSSVALAACPVPSPTAGNSLSAAASRLRLSAWYSASTAPSRKRTMLPTRAGQQTKTETINCAANGVSVTFQDSNICNNKSHAPRGCRGLQRPCCPCFAADYVNCVARGLLQPWDHLGPINTHLEQAPAAKAA
jgi:hypothetical protein